MQVQRYNESYSFGMSQRMVKLEEKHERGGKREDILLESIRM
jgi:hypothetical protein